MTTMDKEIITLPEAKKIVNPLGHPMTRLDSDCLREALWFEVCKSQISYLATYHGTNYREVSLKIKHFRNLLTNH